jgi:hypothetical protein
MRDTSCKASLALYQEAVSGVCKELFQGFTVCGGGSPSPKALAIYVALKGP